MVVTLIFMKLSYIYIITNSQRTVLYTGVTADLASRMEWHLAGKGSKFCSRYNVKYLIYYEVFNDIREAIRREKYIKGKKREWKMDLIKRKNPQMLNLYCNGFFSI